VLAELGQAAAALQLTTVDTSNEDDAVVTGARWIAQNKIGQNLDEAKSKLTADAEHLALSGELSNAIAKLAAAYNL
jgi:beta-glucosidase